MHNRIAVDRARLGDDEPRLPALGRDRVHPATEPQAHSLSRRRSLPGVGTILALVRLEAIHDLPRVPRGQALAASGRWVTGAKAAAGQRDCARVEKPRGQGNACTVLAHLWARAVYDLGTRATLVARETLLQGRTERWGRAGRLTGR